jgi:hypothetical protein
MPTARIGLCLAAAFLGGLCGCARQPTTALLVVEGPPVASVTALFAQVALAAQPPGPEQQLDGPIHLPGTLVVWLPDVAEPATILLRGVTSEGQSLWATAALQIVPHQQVSQAVVLSASGGPAPGTGVDGGMADRGDLGLGRPPDDMASPTADMASAILAQDNFHRTPSSQPGWGTASDGQIWGDDANASGSFLISGNRGVVAEAQGPFDTAVLGPSVSDAEVLVTGAISPFAGAGNNNESAAMLRWVDDNMFYKAGIDGASFRLYVRTSPTSSTTLARMPFTATPATAYSIRFRIVGTALMGKVWPAAGTEPANWMLTATDASIAAGACGIRLAFNSVPATATFTSFVATAAR